MDSETIKTLTQTSLDSLFIRKCIDGKNEDVKYLLTSPELELHPNIYINDSHAFKAIAAYKNRDLLQFFILVQNFKISPHINTWLHSGVVSEEIRDYTFQLIEKRKIKAELEKDLAFDDDALPKSKHKI